jgi:ribosomal protein S18 acetylase RimI-like enzyme
MGKVMSVKIRRVAVKDLDGCFFVEKNCYTTEAASREKIAKRLQLYPTGFFVAELKGHIVGIINGTSTNAEDIADEKLKDMIDFDEQGKNMVIFSVAVLPEHRGQGIAGLLLNRFIIISGKLRKKKIFLICKEKLIGMYQKFGFQLVGKSKSRHGGFEWFEMVRPI